ncbi:prophage tail fiber N-terminal domain-containing protein [Serratia liquefaciens]|uniref:prophage tail fiber N-terminal domain-containing protein n=1 Tax=Serratia liquefaciens TaxID=614 RepID=UPI003CFFA830
MVLISGVLKGPYGDARSGVTITMRSLKTSSTVLNLAKSQSVTNDSGQYSLNVEPGAYEVIISVYGAQPERVGTIEVYTDSLAGTLNDFLTTPGADELTPAIVAMVDDMRAAAAVYAEQAQLARDEAKESASKAQNIADANTYYITPSDPDGTIAGLAGTPNGKSFRVGQGAGSDTAFIYYVNNNGVAKVIAKTGGAFSNSYQEATSVSGTVNEIQLTIPGLIAPGTAISFTASQTNTGPVNAVVTNVNGVPSSPAQILMEGNSPLAAGTVAKDQPVLMKWRGPPTNNWVLMASGGVSTILSQRATVLEKNAVVRINTVTAVGDAYSGDSDIAGSALIVDGRRISFIPPATNTTRAPSIKIGLLSPINIRSANGGQVVAGDMTAGYPTTLEFNKAGNHYRVISNPFDHSTLQTRNQKGVVTSDASSPNVVSITIPGYLGEGTEIIFEPTVANTGALQVTITDIAGYTQTRNVLKGPNTACTGGELFANIPAKIIWRAAPIASFKLLWSGDLTTGLKNVNADIANLKTAISDPLATLKSGMIETPFGSITFNNGVKTVVKNRLIMTSIGSSVGVGAAAGPQYAPNAMLVASMKKYMENYGEFDFVDDNQCIPTQAWQQFEAQLNNSPYTTSDILLIVGGMNDAPVGNFNMGRTFPQQKAVLDRLIQLGQARGAIVIVCTSPHHNVEMPQTAPTIPGGNPLLWPVRTYNLISNYAFNAESRTISSGYFASAGYGGHILRPGYTLRVESGVNFGNYTIESISDDRATITVIEEIPETSRYGTTVRHFKLETIMEDILYPPPSQSVVTKDWTGSGVLTAGDVRFEMENNMQRASAREYNAILADCDWSFRRYGIEAVGYSGVYDVPKGNFNHPTPFGYTVGFGKPLDEVARYISDMAFQTRLFGRS